MTDLLDSWWCYTDNDAVAVLVFDAHELPPWTADLADRFGARLAMLLNPRSLRGEGLWGGLFCGVLAGLRWIYENTGCDWVLKLDTDSLVIAPYADRVRSVFADNPATGMIGTVGGTCNRRRFIYGREAQSVSPLVRALSPPQREDRDDDVASMRAYLRTSPGCVFATHIRDAMARGFRRHIFCQGGGYSVRREALRALFESRYVADPLLWADLPAGEDLLLAMYLRALGWRITDCSDRRQVFGLQWRGLPFPPADLLAQGYAVIHSVKNDPRWSEDAIRTYFAGMRVQLPGARAWPGACGPA